MTIDVEKNQVEPLYRFPEYGSTGDHTGARRMRRSFRFAVAAVLLLTAVLWFSERYLRHDLAESQFLAALTLEPESARVLLRQVVKEDETRHDVPTLRYLAALASREEDDLVLATYDKAHKIDPNNSSLALRYGVRLFTAGRYGEARERFREAGTPPHRNALAVYLEAATIPWLNPDDPDVAGSLALVTRANNSKEPVSFPEPVWSDELPHRGVWYSDLRRKVVGECCAPLYRYADFLVARAKRDIALKQVQYWDSWLQSLQVMGERVLECKNGGVTQAIAGIRIQLDAVEQIEAVYAVEGRAAPPDLIEARVRLLEALETLSSFEDDRGFRIEASKERYRLPLAMVGRSIAVIACCWVLALLMSKLAGRDRAPWAVPHSKTGIGALGLCCIIFLVVLAAVALLQPLEHVEISWLRGGVRAWWGILAFFLAFGLVYPASLLPRVSTVLRNHRIAATRESRRAARESRRCAYGLLVRRYYGVLLGGMLSATCVWVLLYRLSFALYPWQVKLLVNGLMGRESETVAQVLDLLH